MRAVTEVVEIGVVLRPWGREGAVVVEPLTHDPRRFEALDRVQVRCPGLAATSMAVDRVRIDRDGRAIVWLGGVGDLSRAEDLRGARLCVPEEQAVRPSGRSYFNHELVGLQVVTTAGRMLGRVEEVLETGGTNVLVVRGDGGEYLIPAADEILAEVDPERGRLVVAPPAGLLEINQPEPGGSRETSHAL